MSPTLFVGRQRELAHLDRLVAEGVSRTVEIAGEPGIGKTRLLAELATRARKAGWLVLSGRAAEAERHVPFSVLNDALQEVGPDRLAALEPGEADLLRTAFPVLSAGAVPPEFPPAERYRLHRALRTLLESLAAPAGLLVLLDDLHWADEGTAEVVDHLLRRPPGGRLVLGLAHRSRQTSSLLRRALAQSGDVVRLELGPLTPAEVAELAPLDEARGRALYETSGGNPFYVQALAGPYGDARSTGSTGAEIPEPVQAALLAELDTLSPEQLLVVRAAAVAGDGVPADLIAKTAGSALDEVLPVLDALARRDLIRVTPAGGRFRFRHPLVRRVAYDVAGAGWRVAAHARAAVALRESGRPAAERAHHVELSATPGDLEAVDVLRQAAAVSLHRAPAESVHWVRAALRLVPDSTPARIELLLMRAHAYGLTGQFRDCRATLHELRRLLPAELTEQHAQIAAFCALIERFLGRHTEARAQLLAELTALTDQRGKAALALKLGLANGVALRADRERSRDWAAEALETARRHPERPTVAAALAMCALQSHVDGRVGDHTVAWLAESALLIDAATDTELVPVVETVGLLGSAELCQERFDDAVRHLTRALRIVRAAGQSHVVTHLYSMLAGVDLMLGNLDRAAGHLADELDSAHLTGSPALRSFALRSHCLLAIAAGDAETAVRLGKEALAIAEEAKLPEIGMVSGTLGFACFLAGDAATCVELMAAGGGGPDLWQVYPVERGNWYETLAAAEASLGHAKEAFDWADRAFAEAAELPRRTGLAELAQAHARLPADPRGAADAAVRAVELLRGAGDRLGEGRAHVVAGTAFGACAEMNHARAHFGEARVRFEVCGASHRIEDALRVQRRVNARQPRGRGESDTLTERERQVAELVAKGLTNSQIGEALYVSPKTVAVHVGRLLTKLDVSRRAGIASRLSSGPGDRA